MSYTSVHLDTAIEIHDIVTIHYFEYNNTFTFSGESHDFWEFLCVDKGIAEAEADGRRFTLERGDILFHKPNEFHRLAANRHIAPNLVVISFICNSPAMDFFRDRQFSIDDEERKMLAQIIQEAQHVFLEPLNNSLQTQMRKNPDRSPIGEQLIKLYLELFLLHLMRRYAVTVPKVSMQETVRRKNDEELYNKLVEYMHQNITQNLTLEQIAKDMLIGRSHLQQLIRKYHNCGAIALFSKLKIDEAKQLIRNNQLNFTEIADTLGYSSIHYFSRQFKKLTGMTPSEYSSSIKGLSEKTTV